MTADPANHRARNRSLVVVHKTLQRLRPHGETSSVDHVLTYLVGGSLLMKHGTQVEVPPGTVTVSPEVCRILLWLGMTWSFGRPASAPVAFSSTRVSS